VRAFLGAQEEETTERNCVRAERKRPIGISRANLTTTPAIYLVRVRSDKFLGWISKYEARAARIRTRSLPKGILKGYTASRSKRIKRAKKKEKEFCCFRGFHHKITQNFFQSTIDDDLIIASLGGSSRKREERHRS